MEIDINADRLLITLDKPAKQIFIYGAIFKKANQDKLDRVHITVT